MSNEVVAASAVPVDWMVRENEIELPSEVLEPFEIFLDMKPPSLGSTRVQTKKAF
jgi:hypothetical protein